MARLHSQRSAPSLNFQTLARRSTKYQRPDLSYPALDRAYKNRVVCASPGVRVGRNRCIRIRVQSCGLVQAARRVPSTVMV